MNPFRILTEKPWITSPQTAQGHEIDLDLLTAHPPQRVALMFFLAVVAVMFTLFITAYFIRMGLGDWRPMPESGLLWFNTLLLFLASVSLQWTRNAVTKEQTSRVQFGLALGALLTVGFVYGQYAVWQEMRAAGYYLSSNPANAFFYVLTGIHALHMLGGLLVWIRAGIRVWSGASLENTSLGIELCAVYWHFLLIVWLVLFALISYT